MAIKAIPTVSAPIYLSDIEPSVKELEGKCQKTDRAWVTVRQGTEEDNRRRADVQSGYTLRWNSDGSADEIRDQNRRELWTFEVYRTLCGMGNIFEDGDEKVPLLKFKNSPNYDMVDCTFEEFKAQYGKLPSVVTGAILRAVYQLNPDWSWLPATEGED